MSKSEKNYCLILAGGIGSRLWPASRENCPKQFLDFEGTGRTLIQQTYERFIRFIRPENIFISTQESYLELLNQQLPQVPREQILAEPVRRGTLAPVAWGTSVISHLCPDARIVVSPSDQQIHNLETFEADIMRGFEFSAEHEGVIAMGVTPTRPETAYGYVQVDAQVDKRRPIYLVKTFTEKPNLEFAEMFVASGEFLWNTGLFVFNAQYMMHNIIKHVPVYRDEFPELSNPTASLSPMQAPLFYTALPNLSMDYAVLEHTAHRYVQRCSFGWADLGSWTSIDVDAQAANKTNSPYPPTDVHVDGRGNVTLHSEALFDNATGNIVRLPSGHMAVISGLDNFVVAEEDGVLMICPKDDDAAMRRLHTLAHLDTLEE
ncbi:MAG: mannose-1-phosphate guanylyltransferase [Bacteroidales bacterium]|nr:mannose-1-phosphate guanylyltransferase [Bacteroidales bacterium]